MCCSCWDSNPWSFTVALSVKRAFYGTRRFIAVLTRDHHESLYPVTVSISMEDGCVSDSQVVSPSGHHADCTGPTDIKTTGCKLNNKQNLSYIRRQYTLRIVSKGKSFKNGLSFVRSEEWVFLQPRCWCHVTIKTSRKPQSERATVPHTLALQIPSTAHVKIVECHQWTPCSLGKPCHVVCKVGENKYRQVW